MRKKEEKVILTSVYKHCHLVSKCLWIISQTFVEIEIFFCCQIPFQSNDVYNAQTQVCKRQFMHFIICWINFHTAFLKNRPFLASFFHILTLSIQLTEKNIQYKCCNDWIRTADLWCRKRPLYQLSYNHYPQIILIVSSVVLYEHQNCEFSKV